MSHHHTHMSHDSHISAQCAVLQELRMSCVHDDVTCVHDDVTCVHDDVTCAQCAVLQELRMSCVVSR